MAILHFEPIANLQATPLFSVQPMPKQVSIYFLEVYLLLIQLY